MCRLLFPNFVLVLALIPYFIILSMLSARQKDKALDSITEVVQTLKHSKSHGRTMSHDTSDNLDCVLPKSVEFDTNSISTPARLTPTHASHSSSIFQEDAKKSRKSNRISLMELVSLFSLSSPAYTLCLGHKRIPLPLPTCVLI